MSNPAPSLATRFAPGVSGNASGRPSVKWLKELVEVKDPETGITKRQRIAEHLIELATSYTVIHAGRDLELASGRDSVEAAKILFAYCYGKPPPSQDELLLALAEHFRKVETDRFSYALQLLGERAKAMSDKEKADFFNSLVVAQFGSVEMFVKAAESYGSQQEQQEQIVDGQSPGEISAAQASTVDESESKP